VALRSAQGLEDAAHPILVLPTLWYGYSPHHMAFAGTVTLRSETFLAVVQDVLDAVLAQGVRRAVILNGHGGNVSSLDVVASRLETSIYSVCRGFDADVR
jgi:creatinine amidohydrolase